MRASSFWIIAILSGSIGAAWATPPAAFVDAIKTTCQCAGCTLDGINLSQFSPSLKDVDPATVVSSQCRFDGASMRAADLSSSDFSITIRGYLTSLTATSFKGADLKGASLRQTQLMGADMSGADLTGADLTGASIFLANFQNATLNGIHASGLQSSCDAMHGWGLGLASADLTHANLSDAELCGGFRDARFQHANLEGAKLSTSDDAAGYWGGSAQGAELWAKTDFTGANLANASFKDAQSGQPADLSQAILCNTTMPDGSLSTRDC